jgi:carboxylesterase
MSLGQAGLADPEFLLRGRIGVLVCHGFTASPHTVRSWGHALADEGYTVSLPLLPGHGVSEKECNRTIWPQWFAEAERALFELGDHCDRVVVAGLSMGGAMVLRLAQLHPDRISGVIVVNPSVLSRRRVLRLVPLLRWVQPYRPGFGSDIAMPGMSEFGFTRTPIHALHSLRRFWRIVRRDMEKVTAPLLILTSAVDHVVEPVNSDVVASTVSSTDITRVLLPNSFHVATLDYDAGLIHKESIAFIARVTTPEWKP